MNDLDELLQTMIDRDASDLHMRHNAKISYRVDGIMRQDGQVISGDEIYETCLVALGDEQKEQFLYEGSVDFAYKLGDTRFRGILSNVRGESAVVFRKIPGEILPFDKIGLPQYVRNFLEEHWGLILVTGPTGSGKTTTLASLINEMNEKFPMHIATIEQPIEYIHQNKKAYITQREVGQDTPTFGRGVVDVLRQDPDTILVGEMRDIETTSSAITSADTGHLVFGTLHSNTAPASINRIIDMYPAAERTNTRVQLSESLRLIISQRLYPKEGGGRVPAYEIMVVNDEIREAIRKGKTHLLYDLMKKSRNDGNVIMTDSVNYLRQNNLIKDPRKK